MMRKVVCLAVIATVFVPVAAFAAGEAYTVGAGDVLGVMAFQHPEISGEFVVQDDGTISFPLLGHVKVAGMTCSKIASLLERLLERDYYVDVQIQVKVKEYKSKPVTVLGQVQKPGTYYLKGKTTLAQIIAQAGGLAKMAGSSVELRRVEKEGDEPRVYVFPMDQVLSGKAGDIVLRAGDVITVARKELFFVTGEVSRPGEYELQPGMTLMQAITKAGGLGKFASQQVELHRTQDGKKTMLKYDLGKIRKGKLEDPPILPGDVIIVKRRFF